MTNIEVVVVDRGGDRESEKPRDLAEQIGVILEQLTTMVEAWTEFVTSVQETLTSAQQLLDGQGSADALQTAMNNLGEKAKAATKGTREGTHSPASFRPTKPKR